MTGNGVDTDHELLWLDPEKAARDLYLPHQRWAVSRALGLTDKENDDG